MDELTAMRMARAYIRWNQFGECRTPGWDGKPPTIAEAIAALDTAIAQAEQAQPVAFIRDGSLHWWIPSERYIRPRWTNHGEHPLYAAPVAQPVHQPVHGWTDADADAARLALELECILTDKDQPMPSISRWWDSAHEALELHRQRMAEAPTESMDRRAATARPAPAQADLSASGPPITDDDLRAMLPELEELGMDFERGWDGVRAYGYTEDQMLDYGRAIVARMGGMK